MSEFDREDGLSRRGTRVHDWAGAGLLWTVSGGVPAPTVWSPRPAGEARGLRFVQISDSHVGFDKPANPNARGTSGGGRQDHGDAGEARLHHPHRRHQPLSKADEFDNADQIIKAAGCDVHYVPGEHDVLDEDGKALSASATARAPRAGLVQLRSTGVHFVGLVNVVNLKAGGLGNLGPEQLAWLEEDLKGRSLARRSWCSPTSRSGRSIRNGAGAPRIAPRRWRS